MNDKPSYPTSYIPTKTTPRRKDVNSPDYSLYPMDPNNPWINGHGPNIGTIQPHTHGMPTTNIPQHNHGIGPTGAGGGWGVNNGYNNAKNDYIDHDALDKAMKMFQNSKVRDQQDAKELLEILNRKGRNNYKTSFVIEQACVLASEGKIVLLLVETEDIAKNVEREISKHLDRMIPSKIMVTSLNNVHARTRGLHFDTIVADPDVYTNLIKKLL